MRAHFENAFIRMLYPPNITEQDNVFYANLLCSVKVVVDEYPYDIDTLGVSYDNYSFILGIHYPYFNSLTILEQIDVLKHEMMHILLNHLLKLKYFDNMTTANKAMDLAINQHLDNLPEGVLSIEKYGFPADLTTEQYYDLLVEYEKENQSDDKHNCVGDHSNWNITDTDDSGQEVSKIMDKLVESMVKEAVNNSQGNIPNYLKTSMQAILSPPKVNWRRELRSVIGTRKGNIRRTIKRRDRRFPNVLGIKGKIKGTTFNLVVCIDTSYSVKDNEVEKGLVEIRELCRITDTNITVIQVDYEVSDVTEVSKNNPNFTRSGNGGTYMYSGIRYILENNISHDAILYISDLEIEDVSKWEVIPNVPIIWLGTRKRSFEKFDLSNPRLKRMKKLLLE